MQYNAFLLVVRMLAWHKGSLAGQLIGCMKAAVHLSLALSCAGGVGRVVAWCAELEARPVFRRVGVACLGAEGWHACLQSPSAQTHRL